MNIFIKIVRNKFALNTFQLSTGTAISQALLALSLIWLSRLYSPENFGVFSLYSAIISVLSVFIGLRYEAAIIAVKSDDSARSLLILTILLSILCGIFFLALSTLIPKKWYEQTFLFVLTPFFLLIIITSVLTTILSAFNAWLNRYKYYGLMSISRVLQAALAVTLGIIFGQSNSDSGLIYSQAISVFMVTFLIFIYIRKVFNNIPITGNIIQAASDNKNFPLFLMPATLLDVLTAQLPILLITLWFSTEFAGFYSMAWRFLVLPMSLIGGAIGSVFFQAFSEAWPSPIASKRILVRVWKILALIGILPLILTIIFGEFLAKVILGDAWAPVGNIASIMAPMVFIGFISSATSTTYITMGLQKYSLYFVLSSLVYRPFSLWLGYIYNDIYIGLICYVLFEILQNITYQYFAWRHISSREVI